MAIKIEPGKIYHCQASGIASASFHVTGGKVTIYGSNVTEYTTDGTNKLIVPSIDKFVATEDVIEQGIHLIAGVPEFLYLSSTTTDPIWVKMGIDARIEAVEATLPVSNS